MPAAYDQYDYPEYWTGREYEHESEVIALKEFLDQIPRIDSLIDIGSGFGRLTQTYIYRAKKIYLADPSGRLLKLAREKWHIYQKIKYLQSRVQNLSEKLKRKRFDVAIFIRVIHHIENIEETFEAIDKVLEPGGYLILEFANKIHWKGIAKNFLKGDFTFPLDIFPEDRRSQKAIQANTIPFLNFHPDIIKETLKAKRYTILETRSVSNFRSSFLKRYIPTAVLVSLESILQRPLAFFRLGPSIFILARKARVTG